MMLVHVALIVLVSKAWSLDPGNNQTKEKFNASSSASPRVSVEQYSSLKQGKDANLTCGDKNGTMDTMFYVLWRVRLKNKYCEIKFNTDGRNEDTCLDGKSLRNTSKALMLLHIPKFSLSDVGIYTCELVYLGGANNYINYVNITAPPTLSAWIEWRADQKVAVCRAERGRPAANIRWSFTDNSTVKTEPDSDGLINVESLVVLNTNVAEENISCTVTHPYWDEPQILEPKLIRSWAISPIHSAVQITITLVILSCVVFCMALLYLGVKKWVNLRRCQESSSSKSPPREDVEEIEPYESYVQRVNSIYNS